MNSNFLLHGNIKQRVYLFGTNTTSFGSSLSIPFADLGEYSHPSSEILLLPTLGQEDIIVSSENEFQDYDFVKVNSLI